jgi:hypothetical protein
LNDLVDGVISSINELNYATTRIAEITTFADRIQAQLDWAVSNAQIMLNALEQRVMEIENGLIPGNVEDYEELLELLRDEIDTLREIAEGFNHFTPPDVYAALTGDGSLTAFIDSLRAGLGTNEGLTRFIEILEEIDAADHPAGRAIAVTPTTNFKGIPFYMNQLNELVRTFSRAINEGRNRDGHEIENSIGHIFGFDANGENRHALFFTYEDALGNPAILDHADPFSSLLLWVLSEIDEDTGLPTGVPQRDENNNFITVQDPNPPVMVTATGEILSLVAMDSSDNPMFTIDYSRFNALNFIINPELQSDPALLAASSNANIGRANNDIIHGFVAVGHDTSLFREGRLIDFIIATSSHLAVDNHQATMFRQSYSEITTQTHNHRLSVKSVDIEEEMLNLVRFQNMFTATSRLINVLDTVYDTLINRLGNF